MLAVKLKAKGIDRWGAKAIWEVLRYEMALKSVTTGRSTPSTTTSPAGSPASSWLKSLRNLLASLRRGR